MKRLFVPLIALVMLAGCSVVGIRSGYEEPSYEVVDRLDESVEVRAYAPRVAVEARVDTPDYETSQDDAFRLLFDYISGTNRAATKIAMTAPVETATTSEKIAMTVPVESVRGDSGMRMRFFLPASYTAGSAPEPLDPRLRIVEVPAQTVAVLRFSGLVREAAVAAQTEDLLVALENTRYRASSHAVTYFYDPPWTLPFFRRNEVVVSVAR